MLNPQRKKKSRRKRRLEDVLGAEARYSPLEISEDGTFGAHDDAAPFWTKCKCILFGMTMVLLIPILVFVILDKCGFEISIHPKQESQPPPIITGVAQPKQLPSSGENSSNVKPPQEKPIDSKEETIEKSKSDKHTAKTVANEPSIHDKNKESMSRSSRPIPSLAKIDRLQCANDLNTNYDESFRYFHDPDASFCQASKISTCNCTSTVTPQPQSPEMVPSRVWQAAFEKNVQLAESAPSDLDVVILGDSITEHLAGTELGQVEETWERHSAVFNRLFTKNGGGDVEGLALGIGGDACAQLLYRLQNGELTPTLRPKVWWILIGTYDLTNDCSAEATLMGVVAVVEEMLWQRPNDIIVINSILPRPRNKMGSLRGKLWIKTDWINQRLECFAKGYSNVEYYDASDLFLNKDHSKAIKNHYADDWIHPSAFGTQKWGEAIVEKVEELIHDKRA